MREGPLGSRWTPEEDSMLVQAVAVHGDADNWKAVAQAVRGRSNKACRKRWLHSLSPSIKKSAWTAEEDALLLNLHALHGTKWSVIARSIPGRTDDACSKRYREALDPHLRRDDWTADEDAALLRAHAALDGRWSKIGERLGRGGLGCRNRWRMLERRKAAAIALRGGLPVGPPPAIPEEPLSDDPGPVDSADAGLQWPLQDASQPEPQSQSQSQDYDVQYWEPDPQYAQCYNVFDPSPFVSPFVSPDATFSSLPDEYAAFQGYPDYYSVPSAPPPPFNYTSSSLSGALSSPIVSPLSTSIGSLHSSPLPQAAPLPQPAPEPESRTSYEQYQAATAPIGHPSWDGSDDTNIYVQHGSPIQSQYSQVHATADVSSLEYPSAYSEAPTADVSPLEYPSAYSEAPTAPTTPEIVYGPLPLSPQALQAEVVAAQPAVQARSLSVSPDPAFGNHEDPIGAAAHPMQRSSREKLSMRLSSSQAAVPDSNILAYVCGHQHCWPEGASHSIACFATSRQLLDHHKAEHPIDQYCSKPFRCGLAGCGKSWKNINGLQYHLQISKTHFQQALALSLPAAEDAIALNDPTRSEQTRDKGKKMFPCPYPNCRNAYRQHSGLRYHLQHGHPPDMPAQLNVLPPALLAKMTEKLQSKLARTSLSNSGVLERP